MGLSLAVLPLLLAALGGVAGKAHAANTLRCSLGGIEDEERFSLECEQNKTGRRYQVRFEGGISQLSLENGQSLGFRIFCPLVKNEALPGAYTGVRIGTQLPGAELAFMVNSRFGLCAVAGLNPLVPPGQEVRISRVVIAETS
jgi:hypothetical protein